MPTQAKPKLPWQSGCQRFSAAKMLISHPAGSLPQFFGPGIGPVNAVILTDRALRFSCWLGFPPRKTSAESRAIGSGLSTELNIRENQAL